MPHQGDFNTHHTTTSRHATDALTPAPGRVRGADGLRHWPLIGSGPGRPDCQASLQARRPVNQSLGVPNLPVTLEACAAAELVRTLDKIISLKRSQYFTLPYTTGTMAVTDAGASVTRSDLNPSGVMARLGSRF